MEPVMTAVVAEKTAETFAIQEAGKKLAEVSSMAQEWNRAAELQMNKQVMENINVLLEQDRYKKLAEFRELSQHSPEMVRAAYNDIHLKGQFGESLMESVLMQHGEVRTQIGVQLDGVPTGNKIDLQLLESDASLKQWELRLDKDHVVVDANYNVMKGDSASYEVKNGGMPYLRQELAAGELQQQIQAGRQISDHSFVVINEDTAQALLQSPEQARAVIEQIQDAGGKLIVGLPKQSVQMAMFL